MQATKNPKFSYKSEYLSIPHWIFFVCKDGNEDPHRWNNPLPDTGYPDPGMPQACW